MAKSPPSLDLNAPLFTIGEVAEVSGIARSTLDMYLHRGILLPARRERLSSKEKRNGPKRSRGQGRPMFSAVEVFRARLIRELGHVIGLGPSESAAAAHSATETKANWMAGIAEGIESGRPPTLSARAMRTLGKWKFEMQPTEKDAKISSTCLQVPVSALFTEVYIGCKKLLSEPE